MKRVLNQLVLINVSASIFAIVLTGGLSMWVLRLSPEEKWIGTLLIVFLLSVGLFTHNLLIRPMLKQLVWRDASDSVRALEAMRNFPMRAAQLSWYLWGGLDLAGTLLYYLYFGNWTLADRALYVSLISYMSLLCGGGIAFLLMFYAYKIALRKRIRKAGELVRASGRRLPFEAPAYGLRNKLVVSSLTLLSGALMLSVVFGFTRIAEGLQIRLAEGGAAVMRELMPQVEKAVAAEDFEQLTLRLQKLKLGAGGQLFLVDSLGGDKLGLNHAHWPLADIVRAEAADWRSSHVVVKTPLKNGKYIFMAVYPWSIELGPISRAGRDFFLLFVFLAVVVITIAGFSAREIAQPVKDIVYRTERLARGDLMDPMEILSEDEVGEFSADLEQLRRFLRNVLNDVESASRQIDTISGKVLSASQTVAASSAEQSERVNAGFEAVERMAGGFDKISGTSLSLAIQAGEGGMAIRGLDETVHEIDRSTDILVEKVGGIRGGIDKMDRVSELIFANLGDLSRSMDVTVRNIRKFSDSIRRNEERVGTARTVSNRVVESSREGLQLTSQTGESIAAIENSVEAITGALDELILRLNDVGKLINVIDEVADDTKLLSLNAAIIAAQAGAKGRSFSVLAEKIKILADRTNLATGQIISMIEQVGDGSHLLAHGMEQVRGSVRQARKAAGNAGSRLDQIINSAEKGFEGMAVVAGESGRHVDQSQVVERSVVDLANSVEQIHAGVRGQRTRAAEVGQAMARVESGVRLLKTAARAQAEGGRVLSSSTDQVVTMVVHLKQILQDQQSEVHRVRTAIRAIQEGATANSLVSRKLQAEVEGLRGEASAFKRFVDRFKLA